MKNIALATSLFLLPFITITPAHALECDDFTPGTYSHCSDYSDLYFQPLTTEYMIQWNILLPDGSSTPLVNSCAGELSGLLFYMKNPEGDYTIRFKKGHVDDNSNVIYTDFAGVPCGPLLSGRLMRAPLRLDPSSEWLQNIRDNLYSPPHLDYKMFLNQARSTVLRF